MLSPENVIVRPLQTTSTSGIMYITTEKNFPREFNLYGWEHCSDGTTHPSLTLLGVSL